MKSGFLQTVEERESLLLAPYAMHSCDSAGRRHVETEHLYRGPFQRDRDRVLHSSAYRRLSGKMQVFTGDKGDYHRTRLTHTQEVASIARTIGRSLSLNEDLVEALALFHDIGHPPFGHAGEDALDECLNDVGGFSHNRYGLTIAEELETRHQPIPGLNLTYEVLEGQKSRVDKEADNRRPLLEAQVVDAADSITYDAHDTDDAIKLEFVTLEELRRELVMIQWCFEELGSRADSLDSDSLRRAVVHTLIDFQVNNVLMESGKLVSQSGWQSSTEARDGGVIIEPLGELADAKRQLESFLYDRVYRHSELIATRDRAQAQIKDLYTVLVDDPSKMPDRFIQRCDIHGVERSVGDYIAGMTDRFFEKQHAIQCS